MNYYSEAISLYKIFGLDFQYCGQQKQELHHLKWLDQKVGIEKVADLCHWVMANRPEWHRFGLIRSHLDEIIALNQNYSVEFELKEGYKYHNPQLKKEAYERWKSSIV